MVLTDDSECFIRGLHGQIEYVHILKFYSTRFFFHSLPQNNNSVLYLYNLFYVYFADWFLMTIVQCWFAYIRRKVATLLGAVRLLKQKMTQTDTLPPSVRMLYLAMKLSANVILSYTSS
jgi:hypothetical protein